MDKDRLESSFNYMLPQAMVDELLGKGENLAENLLNSLQKLSDKKQDLRQQLLASNLLNRDNDLPSVTPPTTCGVDGASIVERLMSIDLLACAAVAIEGLTPPSETRYWEDVKHRTFVCNESHNPDSGIAVAGIMWQMELELASEAPHDIVFIDGSVTNPIIKMNAAINKADTTLIDSQLGKQLNEKFYNFIESYHKIICSNRSDKFWIGMPKYTSKKEIGERLGWSESFDDRSMLTSILESGEYTTPVKYKQPKDEKSGQDWHMHFPTKYKNNKKCQEMWKEILNHIHNLNVIYYKPHAYTPVLRIEIPSIVVGNQNRLRTILDAIKYQCPTASIIEPYPLYMADIIVKEVSKAVPAIRQIATRKMAEEYTGDLSEVFFSMHSYRTENTK